MKKKGWTKLVSLFLLPAMLSMSIPVDAFAQKELANSVKRMTSSIAKAHYENSYDAFITELQLTIKELSRANKRLGAEMESSEEVSDRLKVVKTLSGKTTIIKSDLKDMRDVAFILSAIPQVRTPMKQLKKSAKYSISKLKTFEKKIKPFHKKMTSFNQRILLKGLSYRYSLVKELKRAQKIFNQSLLDEAKQMDNYINAAAECMNIDNDLSEVSNALDKLTASIALFRTTLSTINNTLIETSSILDDIKISLSSLRPIKADLRALDKLIRRIRKTLRALGKALKKKIKIKFSYDPPWGDAIKVRIRLKLGDILKGPSTILKLIEAKLSGFLWRIAKAFGLKKIVKRFLQKAKREIKKLLSKYNFDFKPKLGNLSKIDGIIAKLEILFGKLGNIYLLPDVTLPSRSGVNNYLSFLPRFQKLALCQQMKEADLEIHAVKIEDQISQGIESTVNVEITDHQDIGILDVIKTASSFDNGLYDHKGILTLESSGGYQYQSEEFLIKAGETKTIQAPWIPQGHGEIQLTATISIVDINEKNLENNSQDITVNVLPPAVDLAVQTIGFEDDLVENSPSVIEVKIANLSDRYTARATLDVNIDDGFTFRNNEIVLDPQSEETIDIEWTPASSGLFKAEAKITPGENRRDTQGNNNSFQKSVTVAKEPTDLAIENFRKADEIYSGEETTLKVRVRNNGPKATDETTRLTLHGDDGYKKEIAIHLDVNESKDVACKWTPKQSGPVQFDIELNSEIEDLNIEDNSRLETIEVKSKDTPIPDYENLLPLAEEWPDSAEIPDSVEEAKYRIKQLLENLKIYYSRGNKASLMELFSKNFPNYVQFAHSIQEDFFFFRNVDLFYRINSITVSPGLASGIANVYWEAQFMLQSGQIYRKTSNMRIRLRKNERTGEWRISGMDKNEIFGASILSSVDLQLLLSRLTVGISGLNVRITGVVVKNKGNALAQNFRVKYTYTRSGGQKYTGYSSVSNLRAGSSTTLSYTFSGTAFIPGPGDSLKVEVDPDRSIPEIQRNNNMQTVYFPF